MLCDDVGHYHHYGNRTSGFVTKLLGNKLSKMWGWANVRLLLWGFCSIKLNTMLVYAAFIPLLWQGNCKRKLLEWV